jgi:hypothetical protein
MSCVLLLLITIGVVFLDVDFSPWAASIPPFISKGDEVTWKVTK